MIWVMSLLLFELLYINKEDLTTLQLIPIWCILVIGLVCHLRIALSMEL